MCCQVLPAAALPVELHTRVARALHVLKEGNMFKKDVVWVNGKLAVTRVSRTLLGEPGLTYVLSRFRCVPRNDAVGDRETESERERASERER